MTGTIFGFIQFLTRRATTLDMHNSRMKKSSASYFELRLIRILLKISKLEFLKGVCKMLIVFLYDICRYLMFD